MGRRQSALRYDKDGTGRTGESDGVDVLAVVEAGHVLLAEADGVLALGDAVKGLELLLRDALLSSISASPNLQDLNTYASREVHLHGKDTDVLGAGIIVGRRHCGGCVVVGEMRWGERIDLVCSGQRSRTIYTGEVGEENGARGRTKNT